MPISGVVVGSAPACLPARRKGGQHHDARRVGQAALALAAGYPTLLLTTRRYHRHWGATAAEIAVSLPGDDLVPGSKLDSTAAITIAAPAARIWPWLAQMGYSGRAGFYSYGALERLFGARHSDRLDPTIPAPAVGDPVPFAPGMPMTVAIARPPHALVLWQVHSGGKVINASGPWGENYLVWSWAFVLEPIAATSTRLLTRMRVDYRPVAKWAPYAHLLLEPAHFVMGRRQLLGLRDRAEAAHPAG